MRKKLGSENLEIIPPVFPGCCPRPLSLVPCRRERGRQCECKAQLSFRTATPRSWPPPWLQGPARQSPEKNPLVRVTCEFLFPPNPLKLKPHKNTGCVGRRPRWRPPTPSRVQLALWPCLPGGRRWTSVDGLHTFPSPGILMSVDVGHKAFLLLNQEKPSAGSPAGLTPCKTHSGGSFL